MDKTTAPGASGGVFVNDNPGGGIVGTLIIAEDQNAHQDEVYNAINGLGITPSAADLAQLYKAIVKGIKEKSSAVLDIIANMGNARAPAAFNGGTPDTYWPRLCLTNIDSYVDINDTNWPDLVPALRAMKMIFKEGLSGAIPNPGVTNWAISSNVATLTFTNNTDHIALLMSLSEDQAVHGSFTNWRTVTLANAIGSITAGTYAITGVNAFSRTITFAFTASNGSGAVTSSVEFYTHRIAGSTTTARVWTARGLALHGVNDAAGYFVSGALRKRDQMQQITGSVETPGFASAYWTNTATVEGAFQKVTSSGGNRVLGRTDNNESGFRTLAFDSANSPGARTGDTTHSPAMSVHLYIHGGRYVA
jgi:hypothetical protein